MDPPITDASEGYAVERSKSRNHGYFNESSLLPLLILQSTKLHNLVSVDVHFLDCKVQNVQSLPRIQIHPLLPQTVQSVWLNKRINSSHNLADL